MENNVTINLFRLVKSKHLIFAVLWIIFLSPLLIMCMSFKGKEFSFNLNYTISEPAKLIVSTTGGNIKAGGGSPGKVIIDVLVKKRGEIMDITLDELKKKADIEITSGNNKLSILVKKVYENNLSISFDIKTPTSTSCDFNTSGGNISVSNLNGTQDLHTSGGNITLNDIDGKIDSHTSGGNITIKSAKSDVFANTSGGNISVEQIDGIVDLHTSGGNIQIAGAKPELKANTSGGNIKAENIDGKTDVRTSGGNLNLLNISGEVSAHTSGGDISANISHLSGSLSLSTSGGRIVATVPTGIGLDLNLSADRIVTELNNFSGKAEKEKIIGKINGGGIPATISGSSITLNYK